MPERIWDYLMNVVNGTLRKGIYPFPLINANTLVNMDRTFFSV